MSEPTRSVVVCVLHGDPELPRWLHELPWPLHLVVNDPGEGRYLKVPRGRVQVVENAEPLGFAQNVNRALHSLWSEPAAPDIAVVLNFDLEMSGRQLERLVDTLATSGAGLVGCRYTQTDGTAAFSRGRQPRPAVEFLRAAGLRSPRLVRLQRKLSCARRPSGPALDWAPLGGYVPWTCVALTRAAWETTGPLDERYPMYAEDIDWGLRLQQTVYRAAVVDVGRVVHQERATRSVRTDTLYEVSHRELHRRWGWPRARRAQELGLLTRRLTPLRWLAPLDWSLLDRLPRSSSASGGLPTLRS